MAKEQVIRGRGRPPEYVGRKAAAIVRIIKAHGLTGAREYLMTEGVQIVPGKGKEKLEVSMPTLGKLAKAAGVVLTRGRPKVAA